MDKTHLLSEEEMAAAATAIKSDKAPGPDQIPPTAVKEAVIHRTVIFTEIINKCIEKGSYKLEDCQGGTR